MATTTSHKVKAIDATYYMVKDVDAQTTFYSGVLGVEPNVAHPGMFSEWTFPGGGSFGLYKTQSEKPSGSGILFSVDDVGAAVVSLKERGVQFDDHQEDMQTCRMAFGTDPEGLTFILHHRKDGTAG